MDANANEEYGCHCQGGVRMPLQRKSMDVTAKEEYGRHCQGEVWMPLPRRSMDATAKGASVKDVTRDMGVFGTHPPGLSR